MDTDLAIYITSSVTIFLYIVTMIWYVIFFLPGGLAKFHSNQSAFSSSLIMVAAILFFYLKLEGPVIRIVFHILVMRSAMIYALSIGDYLRIDSFIMFFQNWDIFTAHVLIVIAVASRLLAPVSTPELGLKVVPWILIAISVTLFLVWGGTSWFYRHRIGHREFIIIFTFILFNLLYTLVVALGQGIGLILSPWVEILCYCLVFIFTHITGLFITYWWNNLTKGLYTLPYFAKIFNYTENDVHPSKETFQSHLNRFSSRFK